MANQFSLDPGDLPAKIGHVHGGVETGQVLALGRQKDPGVGDALGGGPRGVVVVAKGVAPDDVAVLLLGQGLSFECRGRERERTKAWCWDHW